MGSLVSTVGSFIGSNAGNIAKTGGQFIGNAMSAGQQRRAGQQQQQGYPGYQQQGQQNQYSPISQAYNMMGRQSYNPSWMGGLNRRWGPGGSGGYS